MINLYFTYKGSEFCISTGIRIEESHWDAKNRKIVQKFVQLYEPELTDKKAEVYRAIVQLQTRGEAITIKNINEVINNSFSPSRKTIVKMFDEYLDLKRTKVTHQTYMKIKQLREKLRKFEAYDRSRLTPESFDRVTFARFTQWLSLEEALNDNTIATHVFALRGFLKHCNPNGNYAHITFRELYFDVIYLEPTEIGILRDAKMLPPYMEKTRDIFMIAYYSGVRWSDLYQVTSDNVKDDVLHIERQTKTNKAAYPPFVRKLRELLDKYGGKCPVISNQKLNIYLKALFKFLELDRPIIIHKRLRGSVVRESFHLYDLITMHVARKTFIMTLLSKGIPVNDVMHMSGHSDFNSMRPYITVNYKRLTQLSREISSGDYM